MTEFEQEIAKALRPLFLDGWSGWADEIAPRVAAAIEQAGRTGCAMGLGAAKIGQTEKVAQIVAVAQCRGSALVALRGES